MSPPRLELELVVEDGLPDLASSPALSDLAPSPAPPDLASSPAPPDLASNRARIAQLVQFIVARELPPGNYHLSLHLVSDQTIRRLNAEHRGKDTYTDVLSFPLLGHDQFVLPPGEPVALGDVVVSLERAVAQAHEFGHSTEREVAYLVAHGVLHVLGYDHEADDERRVMRQREEEALAPHGFTRD